MIRPLVTDSPESVTAISSPRSARENFSGGPKLKREFGDGGCKEGEADHGHRCRR